jgi:hypothetical protein
VGGGGGGGVGVLGAVCFHRTDAGAHHGSHRTRLARKYFVPMLAESPWSQSKEDKCANEPQHRKRAH